MAISIYISASATLNFVELFNITVPFNINKIDYVDITGDGISDIIVFSWGENVIAYNGVDGSLIKSLEGVNWSTYTEFQDMNNDNHPDLLFQSGQHVKIYDIVDSMITWVSPEIYGYFVFTSGDRNSDGYNDVIFAYKYPFREDMTVDTVWLEMHDGPEYELSAIFPISVIGSHAEYSYPESSYYSEVDYREYPRRIILAGLASVDTPEISIILFTRWTYLCYTEQYERFQTESKSDGEIYYIDPLSSEFTVDWFNNILSVKTANEDNQRYLYAVGEYYNMADGYGFPRFYRISKSLACISADGIIASRTIWSYSNPYSRQTYNWQGFVMGDFDGTRLGTEVAFFVRDTLTAVNLQDSIPAWSRTFNNDQANQHFIFHSDLLFSNTQIMSGYPLSTYDGTNGALSGVFSNQHYNLANIIDLNNDGEDEVITISERTIYINHVIGEPEDVIENEGKNLPDRLVLSTYPNPFNAQTTISYSLAKPGRVTIAIYNLIGQKIATLIDGPQTAGEHSIVWDASGLSSGLYFARLTAGEKSQIQTMTLLK